MKRKQLISLLLLVCVCAASLMTACNKKQEEKTKYTEHSLDYFDTVTTITGYEADEETFNRISAEILTMLGEYHRLFTIYHRFDGMENLCTVNELVDGAHRTVTVDRKIIDLLLYAKEMHQLTQGKMNVAMGSVLSIWHTYRTEGMDEPWNAKLPPTELLQEAAEHTDINHLIVNEQASTVWISDPKMTLDVGAIAKGYAVEQIARALEQRGITGYVLNVGGNIRTIGTKSNGEKWVAGITNPDDTSEQAYVAELLLAGESIVTSGSYQRFYVVGTQSYHHIIDSQTLMPAEGYLSVSIVCKDSGLGDTLSTALFCMPFEQGLALIESLPDVEALWILSDQSQRTSSGFSSYLKTK